MWTYDGEGTAGIPQFNPGPSVNPSTAKRSRISKRKTAVTRIGRERQTRAQLEMRENDTECSQSVGVKWEKKKEAHLEIVKSRIGVTHPLSAMT